MFKRIDDWVKIYFPNFSIVNFLIFLGLGIGFVLIAKGNLINISESTTIDDEPKMVFTDTIEYKEDTDKPLSNIVIVGGDQPRTKPKPNGGFTRIEPAVTTLAPSSTGKGGGVTVPHSQVRVAAGTAMDDGKFIKRWHNIALTEQSRDDIPYSILMAMAMIKSKSGTSKLAVDANNYFNVLGSMDGGYTYQSKKYNKYVTAWASWRAYSNKLSEKYSDAKNCEWYSFINTPQLRGESNYNGKFALMKNNWGKPYKRWAYYLDLVNEDNDPNLANRLIQLIEKHKFHVHDKVPTC